MNKELGEFSRYMLVGVANTSIGYIVYLAFLLIFEVNPFYSNLISYAIGLVVAYFLNMLFVFKSASHSLRSLIIYISGFGVSYLLNIFVLAILILHLNLRPEISQIFAMGVYTISFYLINRFLVWPRRSNS
jgi:putative flippase GtrA